MRVRASHKVALLSVAAGLLTVLLSAGTGQAALFTWSGTTSNAWELGSNWGGSSFPSLYTDQATIGASANNPVSLTTTKLLGGATTVLTIANYSPTNATAMDIAAAGTLGLQGNISLSSGTTNAKKITVEGTLRNDGTAGTPYSITGGTAAGDMIQLVGGTISSLNGGIWNFARPVQGYGTISSPFTNTNVITANVSGQTLHITGSSTAGGTLTSGLSGAILSLESALTTVTINHTGEVDFNGAVLSGTTTLANSGTAAFNVTGNSTLSGTITRNTNTPFTIIGGNTLNMAACTFGNVSGGSACIAIGTGTLNFSSGASTVGNGDAITLAGGQITTTGGTFTNGTPITGRGTIALPMTTSNAIKASGGTLAVTNGLNVNGTTLLTNGVAGDVLDLQGSVNFGSGGFLYTNPSGNTGSGEIRLDGATLQGTINSNLLGQGAVNVVNNSTVSGTYNSSATLGINSGKQLAVTGTLNVNVGSLANSGTLAVGAGTMNNLTASAYSLGGAGTATLAGGTISSTGGGAFTSTNTLTGYGNVTSPFINNGKVIANGGGTDLTLALATSATVTAANAGGQGWFATQHGKLQLPAIAVSAAGAYNWGGNPATFEMVNSIGMTFGGTVIPGNLSIALLSLDRPDVPAGLTGPVDVWSFGPGTLTFGSASMTFRYDDAAALALGDTLSTLGLYGYDGTAWNLIPTTNDTTNMLLTTQSGLSSFYQDFAVAPAPEPFTLGFLALGGVGLLANKLRTRRLAAD
ncbi:MAG: hypothetical protein NT049_01850 [Planctomycetota bacterium]|nr:hypothetical protein [Planctomycetota bacterium]